ncbi:MAG: cell division protein ZapA [Duncaniella sp.]|nr:cell division protein ZapA [Duncaniella sp.]
MSDKIHNITIRIADLPIMQLSIPLSQEAHMRRAENKINELWRSWRKRKEFSNKTSAEILGMVTFQFAQLYYSNLEANSHVETMLDDLEKAFDKKLLDDIIS